MLLLDIGDHLNLLMDRPFTPADVYREVTLASDYATHLIALYPDVSHPKRPPLQVGRTPGEVYGALLDSFGVLERIANNLGFRMLKIERHSRKPGEVVPGDVYDVATLLVAELAYIYVESNAGIPVTMQYIPGRRWPSHVYRQAQFLKAQLAELERLTARDPSVVLRAGRQSR